MKKDFSKLLPRPWEMKAIIAAFVFCLLILPHVSFAASVSPASSTSWAAFDLNTTWSWASSVYLFGPDGLNLETPGKMSINGTQALTAYGFSTYSIPGTYTVLEAFGSYTCTVGEPYLTCLAAASAASGGFTSSGTFTLVSPTCDDPVTVGLTLPTPSSTITNDFPNWQISTPGLLEGCNYSLQIDYVPQIGSLTGGEDRTIINTSPTSNPSSTTISKSKNLWTYYNATTTQINYSLQLLDTASGVTIASEIGDFFLRFSSTSSPLTAPPGFDPTKQCGGVCTGFGTIGGGSIATVTSTIATTGNACVPPSDFTDIGGGIAYGFCTTINYLFVPNAATTAILQNDMNTLQTVPPFSWFFLTNAEIAAVANGDTSYITPGGNAVYTVNPDRNITPNNGVSYTIFTGINGATSSMTLFPADLTTNSFLGTNSGRLVDDYYNIVLTFCIVFAIIMLYKIIL